MKKLILCTCTALLLSSVSFSQVSINTTGNSPNPSAMLEVESISSGFLPPRMTTAQRDAISNPANGLTIYNSTNSCLEFFVGSGWHTIACGCSGPPASPVAEPINTAENQIEWNWSAVLSAQGYKFSSTNNYLTAIDAGSSISYTQTGLTCGTSYTLYVWAYNSCGESAVTTLNASTTACPFVCGSSSITDIDGNSYGTVVIGSQCWMTENLNTTRDASGTSITRYCYDNSTSYCDTYGGLYLWATIMNGSASSSSNPSNVQGICPDGWHIPSDPEWCELENTVAPGMDPSCNINGARGSTTDIEKLRATTTWSGGAGTNTSGYSLLANGYRDPSGNYFDHTNFAYHWTATEEDASNAFRRNITTSSSSRGGRNKGIGAAIRCLKD